MNTVANRWEFVLDERFSKQQILRLAETLHHDEAGISDVCRTMLYATRVRSSYNAAWILHHLATADKKIYLKDWFPVIANFAISPSLSIRRGLVLSILVDLADEAPMQTDLLDFCLTHLADQKESDSSRSMMIKLAARICKPYPELSDELICCLDVLQYDAKPSISAARRNALKFIGNI